MSDENREKRARLPPRPTIRESGIIIDPAFKGGAGIGTSTSPTTELDRAIADDDRLAAEDIRRLRVMEIQTRMKARIAALEKEAGVGAAFTRQSFEITPQMAQAIAESPPEKREELMRIYTSLIAATKTAPSDYGQMLIPMLLGFQRTNPDSGPAAMAAYAKGVSDQILQGITLGTQIAKQNSPTNSPMSEAVGLLNVFSSMYEKSMVAPIQAMIEQLKPQASAFELILTNQDLFDRAKTMGWFGGVGPNSTQHVDNQFALELKKFEADTNIKLAQMNIEDRRWTAEHNADLITGQQRIQTFKEILAGPLGGILQAAGDVTRTRFGGTESPANPTAKPKAPKPMPSVNLATCPNPECNGQFYINEGQSVTQCPLCKGFAEIIVCPQPGCQTQFLIPEGSIEFACPNCHVKLADTEKLKALKQREEELRKTQAQAATEAEAKATTEGPETGPASATPKDNKTPARAPTEAEEAEKVHGTGQD